MTLVLRVSGVALGYIFNIILARNLGAEESGIYFLAFTFLTILSLVSRVGLDQVVVRFIAQAAENERWQMVHQVWRASWTRTTVAGFALTVGLIVLAPWISIELFDEPQLIVPLRWFAASILPVALFNLVSEALKALKLIRQSQIVQVVIIRVFMLVAIIALGVNGTLNRIVVFYLYGALFSMVIGLVLWNRAVPIREAEQDPFDASILWESSWPLFWTTLTELSTSWIGIFALGIFSTTADVGVFALALRTAAFLSFALQAVDAIVAPRFASLFHSQEMGALKTVGKQATSLVTVMSVPLLLFFVVFRQPIMGFFGPDFVEGAGILALLSFGQFVHAVTGPVSLLLIMCGYEKLRRNIVVFVAILNLVLTFAIVPFYGIWGAAWVTVGSWVLQNALESYYVYRRLGIVVLGIPRFSGIK